MDIEPLRYFAEVIRQGSFSVAARRLHISQPALSMRIGQLEEELGYLLIDRSARPLVPTHEGSEVLVRVREILQDLDALEDVAFEIGQEVRGELVLGIIPTISAYLVPLFIGKLLESHPGMELSVEEMVTEDIMEGLRWGDLDAGIVSTPLSVRGVHFTPLLYERFFLYVSEHHPLSGEDAIDLNRFDPEDLWYLREGNCFQNQVNAMCKLSGKRVAGQRVSYSSNSIESLRRIVENRGGMCFIPELATIHIPADREEMVKEIAEPSPVREVSLAVTRSQSKLKLIEALKQSILESIPAAMRSGEQRTLYSPNLSL